MGTIGSGYPNFLDIATQMDPNGDLAEAIDLISEDNTVLEDMVATESNDYMSHRSTGLISAPTGNWRMFNDGVPDEKELYEQAVDPIGMLHTNLKIDVDLAAQAPSPARYRAQRTRVAMNGFGDTVSDAFFYANPGLPADIAKFRGLAPRYSATASTGAGNQIILSSVGTGSGSDCTSVYAVTPGETKTHFIYPRQSEAGLRVKDMKEQLVTGANGDFNAWVTQLKWHVGLVVEDYRDNARLANIDLGDPAWSESVRKALTEEIILMLGRVRRRKMGKTVLYMNQTIIDQLSIHAQEKSNVNLMVQTFAGEPVLHCHGAPIRLQEAIKNTEPAIA